MKTKQALFNIVLLAAFLVSACSGAATPTTDTMMQPTADAMMSKETPTPDAMMQPTEDAMMSKETPTADAMMQPTADAMMESPAWYSVSFTDASTGQAFSINDFKGKVVLVETMAISCSDCKKQQGQVKALHDSLGQREDFVSVGLDVDPNDDPAGLKSYVENNGFGGLYAVSNADVSSEISSLYGDQFLDPPSAPIMIIDSHGEAHPMPFGLKSADELLKFIQPFLDGTM